MGGVHHVGRAGRQASAVEVEDGRSRRHRCGRAVDQHPHRRLSRSAGDQADLSAERRRPAWRGVEPGDEAAVILGGLRGGIEGRDGGDDLACGGIHEGQGVMVVSVFLPLSGPCRWRRRSPSGRPARRVARSAPGGSRGRTSRQASAAAAARLVGDRDHGLHHPGGVARDLKGAAVHRAADVAGRRGLVDRHGRRPAPGPCRSRCRRARARPG